MTFDVRHLKEPKLNFDGGDHICPRRGIAAYGVYDRKSQSRRAEINLGGVGSTGCIEKLGEWIDVCRMSIAGKEKATQSNLFVEFCGFNAESGFGTRFNANSELMRTLLNSQIDEILRITPFGKRVEAAIDLYYDQIKFLAQNRVVDVIVCVIPDKLFDAIFSEKEKHDDALESEVDVTGEINFRRALKARSMHLGKPLQLIRSASLERSQKKQQDDATKAWNFCTALYYKSGPTVPWKLSQEPKRAASCALGVAFYQSRDYKSLQTSLAQIFDELGHGLILRGTPVDIDKGSDDRTPHLTSDAASKLFIGGLKEYKNAMGHLPARVVIHKSSNFNHAEMKGFEEAAQELRISVVDFVTVMDSKLRLLRNGSYPPYRGTLLSIDDHRHLLYTRGSVWYYQTYPGMFIPQPIELRVVKSEESPNFIANEILGLSKMNWNNTQFDGKYPVTLGCARKVGEILKYLSDQEVPQVRYGYYM